MTFKIEPMSNYSADVKYKIGKDDHNYYINWYMGETRFFVSRHATLQDCLDSIKNYIENGWFIAYPTMF